MESTQLPQTLFGRVVLADSRDRVAWQKARSDKWGGSDSAKAAKIESAHLYLRSKLDNPFTGNAYTAHGNDRERHMLAQYGFEQNFYLFASPTNPRHVSTPDGIKLSPMTGEVLLAECKTANKPLPAKTPPGYWRQCQWNMGVMGAKKLLLIWESHDGDFVPTNPEAECRIIERDDAEIQKLTTIADLVLNGMDEAARFRQEMNR